jgi:hypothetical protein
MNAQNFTLLYAKKTTSMHKARQDISIHTSFISNGHHMQRLFNSEIWKKMEKKGMM